MRQSRAILLTIGLTELIFSVSRSLLSHSALQLHHLNYRLTINDRIDSVIDRHIPLQLQINKSRCYLGVIIAADNDSAIHIGVLGKEECAESELERWHIFDHNILFKATALLKSG